MEYNNVITLLVIAIVIIAVVNTSVTFMKYADFNRAITGYASSALGYVNITITSNILINISRAQVDWGSGVFNTSNTACFNVTLITYDAGGVNTNTGCGNWTNNNANAKSMVISNIGNLNCSLRINVSKTAADLFASLSNSNQSFKINVTNRLVGTCGIVGVINGTSTGSFSTWYDVNTTAGAVFCNQTDYRPGSNMLQVDFLLTVPRDVSPTKLDTSQGATITFTADTALL